VTWARPLPGRLGAITNRSKSSATSHPTSHIARVLAETGGRITAITALRPACLQMSRTLPSTRRNVNSPIRTAGMDRSRPKSRRLARVSKVSYVRRAEKTVEGVLRPALNALIPVRFCGGLEIMPIPFP
jgi:hypothetical protein